MSSRGISRRQFIGHGLRVGVGISALGLAACGRNGEETPDATPDTPAAPDVVNGVDEVVIGFIAGLSGPHEPYGSESLNGLNFIFDKINENGGIQSLGGARLRIEAADHQGQNDLAGTLVERLGDSVHMITGAVSSGATLVATTVAERSRIPFLVAADIDPEIKDRGFEYTFKVAGVQPQMVQTVLDFLETRRDGPSPPERIAVAYADMTVGQTADRVLQEELPARGFELTASEGYALDVADLTPVMRRLRDSGADTIIPIDIPSTAILGRRAMRQLGWTPNVVAVAGGHLQKEFTDALGADADGIMLSNYFAHDQEIQGLAELNEEYREQYGDNIRALAACHIAGAGVIADVFERAGSVERDAVHQALRETDLRSGDQFQILPGDGTRFGEDGQNERVETIITQIFGGDHTAVWPEEVAANEPQWPTEPTG